MKIYGFGGGSARDKQRIGVGHDTTRRNHGVPMKTCNVKWSLWNEHGYT